MSPLWLVVAGLGALLLRLGMAVYAAGMVRSKSSSSTFIRAIADISLATLAFWALGYAILASDQKVIETRLLFNRTSFFLLCAALVSSGIVVGVAAERSRFFPMCACSVAVGAVLYPLSGRLISSWLSRFNYLDTGAVTMTHLVGGVVALVAAILIGPRNGKYNRDGSSNGIPGHSVPLASIGALLMLIGWIPTTLGMLMLHETSNILNSASNLLLAAAAGAVASLVLCHFRYGKPDVHLIYTGFLGALVAASASAHVTLNIWAVVIGAVAGILVPLAAITIDLRFKIDDPTSGIAIHFVSSMWGLLAAGLFAANLTIRHRLTQVGTQLLGIVSISVLTVLLSLALFFILRKTIGLRAREADEFDGLDLAEHDIGAYPDFQQTTIKSYHLREA